MWPRYLCCLACLSLVSCSEDDLQPPERIVDLSPTITADLPVRMVGHALLSGIGARDSTEFEHLEGDESLYYLDSYITLFNHAGPHADAPLHLIPQGKAIDQLELASFFGPARVLDYRSLARTDTVSIAEIQEHNIQPGDIVILYVGYQVPTDPEELPVYPVLSAAAAEYLAELAVKAFATDVPGVDDVPRLMDLWAQGVTGLANLLPVHHAFLSREIPVVEGLVNLDAIVGEEDVVFVGFPLKMTGKAGDAGLMRAAALIY
ncbi:MAG: cyclase family protein [Gemmatimonadota bacterium]|nr:MAG: cyclase family protein [Gemmatimonadota bacterium]